MEKKKIGFWIFFGIIVFLVLAVWLTVSNTITGAATSGSLLNKILGIQTTPAAETGESETGAITPSEDVNYQGVLNMLNKCTIIVSGNSTNTSKTCNNVCREQSKTCIQAYFFNGISKVTLPYDCNWAVGSTSTYLVCDCCLASQHGDEVYGTAVCHKDTYDYPAEPCVSGASSWQPICTCPAVGGAVGMII